MQPTPASAMLAKYGLAPSKRRGQNFLADGNVARKVVDAVGAGPSDVVVEIGSGFGAITFGLAEKAGHVVAVEIDSGIARAFEAEYGKPSGITLVNGDILEFDLAGVAGERGVERVLVAGNLPYAVTSPVVRLLLEEKNVVSRAVLMVQAEVGARMVATPGERDYSALSVVLQFHARVRQLFGVRPILPRSRRSSTRPSGSAGRCSAVRSGRSSTAPTSSLATSKQRRASICRGGASRSPSRSSTS